jgi:hypothetical protein
MQYLDAGASHVIVTSFVFREGRLEEQRLADLVSRNTVLVTLRAAISSKTYASALVQSGHLERPSAFSSRLESPTTSG